MADTGKKKTIVVEQIGSPIRRPAVQRATLIGLGLNKMHKRRTLIDSPQVRGMVAKISHLVRIVDDEAGKLRKHRYAAERDQRHARRDPRQEAARPRHRLGPGQDLGQGRQGPEGALRRRHQGLRRRPDAAASAPAEARLQQHLRQEVQRAQSRPHPGCRRFGPARRQEADHRRGAAAGGADPPRQGRRAPARPWRDHRQACLRGHRRVVERDQGGRGERRHGHAEIDHRPGEARRRQDQGRQARRQARGEGRSQGRQEGQGRG